MLITSQAKALTTLHPNINITLKDNTIIQDDSKENPDLPRFNMLIPIVVDRGMTNTMEIFYPNEPNRYILTHGNPNMVKYGVGPNIIHQVMASGANVGIYTINLRGEEATKPNMIVSLKYRVEPAVPYTDMSGNPYYIGEDDAGNRVLTLDAGIDNQPVVRDVLHVKIVSSYVDGCKQWVDMHSAMNNMMSDMEDEDGYKTLPWFSVMYKGAGSYGNSIYFSMEPRVSDADRNVYYSIALFDGNTLSETDSLISLDENAGKRYGADYFIERAFNTEFPTLRFMASEFSDTITGLFQKYLYTLQDVLNGNDPSVEFSKIDPFTVEEFGIVVDGGSINSTDVKAFQLFGGTDGDLDRDKLFEDFFKGKIITDIKSILRYRFSYIPDLGYTETTKAAILDLVTARCHTTVTTLMVGGYESFQSAIAHRGGEYYADMPCVRLLPMCQAPMRFDSYIRKTLRFPATYYDTMALVKHIKGNGVPYYPFAGASVRWTDYIEDTMVYPEEEPKQIDKLTKARINCVMKDRRDGAYLSDQLMNVNFESDQTEFNNAIIISDIIYDLVELIHNNHFTFNEAEDVAKLKELVVDAINTFYKAYSASLNVDVYRPGTTGRAGKTRIVAATIDLKDIARFAQINLVLEDN